MIEIKPDVFCAFFGEKYLSFLVKDLNLDLKTGSKFTANLFGKELEFKYIKNDNGCGLGWDFSGQEELMSEVVGLLLVNKVTAVKCSWHLLLTKITGTYIRYKWSYLKWKLKKLWMK